MASHGGCKQAQRVRANVPSADVPFDGTAYLTTTVGPGTTPAEEVAHSTFHVAFSDRPSFVELFEGLALPPDNYWLTLVASNTDGGLWVAASPFAIISTSPDTGVGGGVGIADGPNHNAAYPPRDKGSHRYQQARFGTQLGERAGE